MRFLMLVCRDESIAFSPEDRGTIGSRFRPRCRRSRSEACVYKGTLADVDATTNVRVREGVPRSTAVRAWMTAPASGFNLIECADLDEAIEASGKHPIGRYGLIALRPIIEG
jgi:hypothetical protein